MLRTLHGYLMRDLVRVTLLSAVAFTLLLTILAIIQPLRKMGLATEQVVSLFGYTLPAMVSLTLPVAALFAATIVYGRFSQDNELLACRASGVSTLALLKPALVLGTVVTVISLFLSNFVTPSLATRAGKALKANLRGIIYHRLKRDNYFDFAKYASSNVVHADIVDADNDQLHGVVYVRGGSGRAGNEAILLAAATAQMGFQTDPNGFGKLNILLLDPTVFQARDGRMYQESSQPIVLPLDNPIEEKPSWCSWTRLLAMLEDPSLQSDVNRRLKKIREWICGDLLGQEVVRALRSGQAYTKLRQGDETYEIRAPRAAVDRKGATVLGSQIAPDGTLQPVEIKIRRPSPAPTQSLRAKSGKVITAWSPTTGRPHVTLELTGEVTIELEGASRSHRDTSWVRGQIPVPANVQARSEEIRLSDVYTRPGDYTSNARILAEIQHLKTVRIPRLKGDLIAELHARVGYGVSCFLMVAMGAALGLIFRGGQFISAFAISVVPAACVIIMLMMGKQMVGNPGVKVAYGLACIWGGIVALLIANVLIYLHLARK